jgi:hypothetical protein
MIVWSRGLGKQRLPLELPAATLRVASDSLVMEGTIEPVCWRYAIRLSAQDLKSFLKLLADPKTAKFLAEEPGVLVPFVLGLVAMTPRLILRLLTQRLHLASPAG